MVLLLLLTLMQEPKVDLALLRMDLLTLKAEVVLAALLALPAAPRIILTGALDLELKRKTLMELRLDRAEPLVLLLMALPMDLEELLVQETT